MSSLPRNRPLSCLLFPLSGLFASACWWPGPNIEPTDSATSPFTTSDPTEPTGELTTTTDNDPTTSTTSPDPFCGDGIVNQASEECDDGDNNADNAACTAECTIAKCGDGLKHEGVEECDDGPQNSNISSCKDNCTLNTCGDGSVHDGVEDCDPGQGNLPSPSCNQDCTTSVCGDGVLNEAAGEECDDGPGNAVNAACTSECKVAICGDGVLSEAAGEECDYGRDNADDAACTSQCALAVCGDGLVHEGVEQCDDDEDYCDDTCVLHPTVFVSSQSYNGVLGGLQGADEKCQDLADAAGLAGEFQAWLSDSESSPSSRFGISDYHGDFVLVDGTVVAHGWEQLTSGQLKASINLDENGKYEHAGVWTGTTIDGTSSGIHCENWKSSENYSFGYIGTTFYSDFRWTDYYDETHKCSLFSPLYCIQTAPADP